MTAALRTPSPLFPASQHCPSFTGGGLGSSLKVSLEKAREQKGPEPIPTPHKSLAHPDSPSPVPRDPRGREGGLIPVPLISVTPCTSRPTLPQIPPSLSAWPCVAPWIHFSGAFPTIIFLPKLAKPHGGASGRLWVRKWVCPSVLTLPIHTPPGSRKSVPFKDVFLGNSPRHVYLQSVNVDHSQQLGASCACVSVPESSFLSN